jgi:hypothetical protein
MRKAALGMLNDREKFNATKPLDDDFVDMYVEHLYDLFDATNVVPEGRNDKRSFETNYEFELNQPNPNGPAIIHDVVNYIREKFDIPDDCSVTVHAGMYMRTSVMSLDKPDVDVLSRVLLNIGQNELYKLQVRKLKESKNKKKSKIIIQDSRDVYLASNSMLHMGASHVCDYGLYVGKNPKFEIPGMVDQIKLLRGAANTRTSIRPLNYKRISIVIDFHGSAELAAQLHNVADMVMERILADPVRAQKMAAELGIIDGNDPVDEENFNALKESLRESILPSTSGIVNAATTSTADTDNVNDTEVSGEAEVAAAPIVIPDNVNVEDLGIEIDDDELENEMGMMDSSE